MEETKQEDKVNEQEEESNPEEEIKQDNKGEPTTATVSSSMKSDDNEPAKSESQDFAAYEEHMTYGSDGAAYYTDPSTKQKYKWCTTESNWQPLSNDTDPYENEHYKWCPKTQQWLPKQKKQQETETEHYKWDEEQQKWLPKQKPLPGQDVVYGVDENGDRTYTDKDGAVFFWDAAKNAWFPKIDDDFMARYQMNYGFIDNTSAGEKEKAEKEAAEVKRKEEELKRMTAEAEAAMAQDKETSTAVGAPTGKRKIQEPPSESQNFV